MATLEQQHQDEARLSTRTRVVWLAFAISMTMFGLIFLAGEWSDSPQMVRMTPYSDYASQDGAFTSNGILPRNAGIDSQRWTSIVIHHSGYALDDHHSIAQRHRSQLGYSQLGYHFVIGNGSKQLGNGQAYVSERWDRQLSGAHVPGDARGFIGQPISPSNDSSIGICLVGNGNSHQFSPKQVERLVALIVELQREFGISDDCVWQASDISNVSGPGRAFPTLRFEQRIAIEN